MGSIKDQFGNVAMDQEAIEAIIQAIQDPEPLAQLDFKASGASRLG